MAGPAGLALSREDVRGRPEAVAQRGGELLALEDLRPLGEGEVGGHDRRAAAVPFGEEAEEQLRFRAVQRDEPEFVGLC